MKGSTASQGSRRDARPASDSDRWPRVGAFPEGETIVVRPLAEGERPHPALQRMVRIAEPCERHRTLSEAVIACAASLASDLRLKVGGRMAVEVRV